MCNIGQILHYLVFKSHLHPTPKGTKKYTVCIRYAKANGGRQKTLHDLHEFTVKLGHYYRHLLHNRKLEKKPSSL